ncbi:MAG: hypothetical protein ACM31M_00355, partial [Nitrososphaerota archaeon]
PAMSQELKARILEQAPAVIEFWITTMKDKKARWDFRNKAAENLIAYGYGKPKETVDLNAVGEIAYTIIPAKEPKESSDE